MALRIIRKSASQSQVELVKGSGEGNGDNSPLFSLMFFAKDEDHLQRIAAFIENNVLIQNKAQCIIMKASEIRGNVRGYFSPVFHTIKILNAPEDSAWSVRLHTLLKEAECDTCIFLPSLPDEADLLGLIEAQQKMMQNDPTLGILGSALCYKNKIVTLGQTWNKNMPEHTLHFGKNTHNLAPEQGLVYMYEHMNTDVCKKLESAKILLAEAVALPFSAIRRSAYLNLSFEKDDWSLPWLAQDLGFAFQKQQYRVGVLPFAVVLDSNMAHPLQRSAPPEAFVKKHPQGGANYLSRLYKNHGFAQEGMAFVYANDHREARIRSYIEHKV